MAITKVQGAKLRSKVVAADPYRLASSIKRRTGCSMGQARRRAKQIKCLAGTRLSSADHARLLRNVYQGKR